MFSPSIFASVFGAAAASGGDVTAPALVSAIIPASGLTLAILYNEPLDTGSVPDPGDFSMSGTSAAVSSVAVAGSTVTLTFDGVVIETDTPLVSYTPGTNPIRDSAGNDAASLTNQSVTNNSEAPPQILTDAEIWYRNGELITNTAGEASAWGNSGSLALDLTGSGDLMLITEADVAFNGLTSLHSRVDNENLVNTNKSLMKFLWDGSDFLHISVTKVTNSGGNQTIFSDSDVSAGNPGILNRYSTTNSAIDWFTVADSTNKKTSINTGESDGAVIVYMVRYESSTTTLKIWANGVLKAAVDYSAFLFSANDSINDWLIADFSTTFLDGKISDLVCIEADISEADALAASAYLGTISGAY